MVMVAVSVSVVNLKYGFEEAEGVIEEENWKLSEVFLPQLEMRKVEKKRRRR